MGSEMCIRDSLFTLASASAEAIVETCSGWEVNRHPQIRIFVKEAGGVDQYKATVKYISSHNPDLVLKDGDNELERIDLTKYKTQDELHKLFAEKVPLKATVETKDEV